MSLVPFNTPQGDVELQRLRLRLAELEKNLAQSDATIADLRSQLAAANRSRVPLQKLLSPWKHAIDSVFGLVEDAGVVEEPSTTAQSSGKWNAIKSRLTPKQAQIIDLLLIQGQMTQTNIANATKNSGEGTRQMLMKLRGQGLVEKTGIYFSLK